MLVTGIEFVFPPIEQRERSESVRHFVAEVVGLAAIGINIVQVLVQFLGQKPGNDVEVFVVMCCQPACIGLGLGGRTASGRRFFGNVQFAWSQHEREKFPGRRRFGLSV